MALDMELRLVEPNSPNGMVLISKSNQQRWIWPVHLSGWLAQGWQWNQPTVGSADAPTAGHIPVPAVQPETDAPQAGSAAAKRRGRKAKSVDAATTTDPFQDPMAAENEPLGGSTLDLQEPAAGADLVSAGPEQVAASGTEPSFALPDDLLNREF
jgi:hypothetical protein